MTKDGKLGVGVIGCGDMGEEHSYAWAQIPEALPVVVVDHNKDKGREFMARYGFKEWFSDYHNVLERDDIDVVSVCVPTALHAEITIKALEAGKHVICEKPIALTLADAENIVAAAKRAKGKFTISFQRRHSAEYRKIKELIAEDSLGYPVMSVVHTLQEIRPKRAMHDAVSGNGGPIIDCMCHYFDFWRGMFASEPVRVTAHGFTLAKDRPELAHLVKIAPDTANISVEYASGDIGVTVVSWGLPPKVNGESLWEFFGPKGLLYPGFDNLRMQLEGGRVKVIESLKMRYEIIRNFTDCILQDKKPLITAEDGLVALKVSLAAIQSMESGMPVTL